MALDELLDEHEQGERVREWVRHNAAGVIGGIVVALALVAGVKWWQAQAHGKLVATGETYQSVLDRIAAGDLDKAKAAAAGLDDGIYPTLAALDLAKAQLGAGKRDDAIATLRGIGNTSPALRQVADRRLARLLVDAGKADEALKLLAGATDPAGLEARGDAHAALGNREEARKAYADALTALDVAAPQRRLLEIKLTDAGGVPADPETQS